jgi:hypothetical protein
MSDFSARNVAYGLKHREFVELPEWTKRKLVRLMARIAEQSYRRGFQHGTLGLHCIDPYVLRFERSLDKSPFTDVQVPRKIPAWNSSLGHTAIERLFMECGCLNDIGFWREAPEYVAYKKSIAAERQSVGSTGGNRDLSPV